MLHFELFSTIFPDTIVDLLKLSMFHRTVEHPTPLPPPVPSCTKITHWEIYNQGLYSFVDSKFKDFSRTIFNFPRAENYWGSRLSHNQLNTHLSLCKTHVLRVFSLTSCRINKYEKDISWLIDWLTAILGNVLFRNSRAFQGFIQIQGLFKTSSQIKGLFNIVRTPIMLRPMSSPTSFLIDPKHKDVHCANLGNLKK